MNKKNFVSIKAKLLAIILPIVIIIVAILTIISYLVSKSVIASYSENLLSSSIQNQGNEIEAWLNENLSAFQAIKHNIEQTKPNDAQLQTLLDQYYDYNSNYPDGLYLADGQGNLMTASASSKSEQNPTSSVWYTEGLTRINMGFTSAYTNSEGTAVISASGILNDGSGKQRVIAADMSLQRINVIVNSFIEMTDAQAFLVSTTDNTILAHRDTSLISTKLDESNSDAFLSGVAARMKASDYTQGEIAGNETAFLTIDGTDWLLVSYVPTSIIFSSVTSVRNIMLLIGIVCILVLAVVIERVIHLVIKPIKELTHVITQMTDGDFTVEVRAASNDEIGKMSSGVSKFLATMRDMIDSIHNVSDKLHEQSQSSLEISDKMREASTTQSDSMQQLNETVEQLSASVNDIAEHATTLANVVADTREDGSQVENKMKETVEISEKGRTDMNQVNTAMQTINESINSLKAAIDKVGTASSEITNITAVIADIAEETNLLSLNASIEAARAGENGRGFAVVATQIGKLAQTSAESVHTIENLIQQINGYVDACVAQANVSVSNIGESGQLISVALATFDSIFQNIAAANELVESMVTKVSKVDDVATNVAAISEEQAASSQEILATSDTMVSQAQEITRSSTHAAEDSKELSVSAEELSNQVNKFKI